MTITLKLFAILKDRAGLYQTTLELPAHATVAEAVESIAQQHLSLKTFLPKIAYAVNEEYVASNTELHHGDELALIPAVSGGTNE